MTLNGISPQTMDEKKMTETVHYRKAENIKVSIVIMTVISFSVFMVVMFLQVIILYSNGESVLDHVLNHKSLLWNEGYAFDKERLDEKILNDTNFVDRDNIRSEELYHIAKTIYGNVFPDDDILDFVTKKHLFYLEGDGKVDYEEALQILYVLDDVSKTEELLEKSKTKSAIITGFVFAIVTFIITFYALREEMYPPSANWETKNTVG